MSGYELTLKTETNRLRRGWILRILNYSQHHKSREMNDRLILSGLGEVGHQVSMPTLHADLSYLQEKGYVELREPDGAAFGMRVAAITAKGVDLYEGSIDDAGVDFGHD